MKVAQNTIKFLLIVSIALFSIASFASDSETKHDKQNDGGRINTKEEVEAYILHHIKDSHDFSLFSYTSDDGERKHVGFPLPVILWSSEGLVSFMSSEFHHNDDGHVLVEKNGLKFAKIHSKIYELDKGASTLSFDETHHATNAHKVLDFSITKSVVGILLIGFLLLFWFSSLAKQYKTKKIPTGFARVLEPLVLYVRDEIARPNIGEKHYRRFTGYLLTVFFLIWLLNLLGMTPLGINVTGNISVTICLALFTYFITQFSANKDYWKHIFWMPGVPVPMKIILMPIEILGTLTKPFALLIRLFANITAGHVVIMSLIAMIFVGKNLATDLPISLGLTLFISIIEVLVAFLQAFIFTMLSSLFIGMAVQDHHHDDNH